MKAWKAKNENNEILVLKETMIESIIADTYGYFMVGLLFWFNYNFIGGSYVVNVIILIMIAIKFGKIFKSYKTYSVDEVIHILEELKSPPVRLKGGSNE